MSVLSQKTKAYERQRQALVLRLAGVQYSEIARQLGYSSAGNACRSISSVMQRTLREPADELRTLELHRTEALLIPAWRRAQEGDMQAAMVALRILERRAKLLGLDAPAKLEHSGKIQYEELTHGERVDRLAGLLALGRGAGAGGEDAATAGRG